MAQKTLAERSKQADANVENLAAAMLLAKQVDARTITPDARDALREAKANLQEALVIARRDAKALAKELKKESAQA